MFTHPETMRALSAEIRSGLLAEAEQHRRVKAARQVRRVHRARRRQDSRTNR